MILRSLLACCAACCALPAAALQMRPDRDEAEYLELAARYTSSITLPGPGGEAVLIAPRWLLTAAHRAKALQATKDATLAITGRSYAVESIHLHPEWRAGREHDIALVRLRQPVRGVEPTPIYRGTDEPGKTVIIVAHGEPGRIGSPATSTSNDRRARAAINTVERVSPAAFGLRTKPPEEASDLQGALTAAQTGAGAYLETPGGIFLAGIHQAREEPGWNLFARISAYAGWIEATHVAAERDELEALLRAAS